MNKGIFTQMKNKPFIKTDLPTGINADSLHLTVYGEMENIIKMRLALNLKHLREQKGKTLEEMAKLLYLKRKSSYHAYIVTAKYEDGTELTAEEIEEFQEENYGLPNELIHDNQLYL